MIENQYEELRRENHNSLIHNYRHPPSPDLHIQAKRRVLTGNLINYSARFFVLKINEPTTLREIDRRAFLSFELNLSKNLQTLVRGKVKESLSSNLFFFETGEIDYFQKNIFIGSSSIITPTISLYYKSKVHGGLLEEISEYEIAISMKLKPKDLSPGQIFTHIEFHLSSSTKLEAYLFLKEVTQNKNSYVLILQNSRNNHALRDLISKLSILNQRYYLSPIFYSKRNLEQLTQNLLPSNIDKLTKLHKVSALKPTPINLEKTTENSSNKHKNFLDSQWLSLNENLCQQVSLLYYQLPPNRYHKNLMSPQYININNPFIDPKWTKPEIAPPILRSYILAADNLIGMKKTNLHLLKLGFDRTYFTDLSNWVSLDFLEIFIHLTADHCNNSCLQKQAGRELLHQEVTKNHIYKHLIFNSHCGLKGLQQFFLNTNKTIVYKYEKRKYDEGLVTIHNPKNQSQLSHNYPNCDYWQSILENCIQLITNSTGEIKKLTCSYKGDNHCAYQVSFQPRLWPRAKLLASLLYKYSNPIESTKISQEKLSLAKYEELQMGKQPEVNDECVSVHTNVLWSEPSKQITPHIFKEREVTPVEIDNKENPLYSLSKILHIQQSLILNSHQISPEDDLQILFQKFNLDDNTCFIPIQPNGESTGLFIAERKGSNPIDRRDITLLERVCHNFRTMYRERNDLQKRISP